MVIESRDSRAAHTQTLTQISDKLYSEIGSLALRRSMR